MSLIPKQRRLLWCFASAVGSNPTPSAILILGNVEILIDAKLETLFFMENKLDRLERETRAAASRSEITKEDSSRASKNL